MTDGSTDAALGGQPRVFDIAVVGGGPAGLAAAVTAADRGRTVVLIDAGLQLGGQYWRHPDESWPQGPESQGHHDWEQFSELRARARQLITSGRLRHHPTTQVWFVEPDATGGGATRRTLHLVAVTPGAAGERTPSAVRADTLILCPGGYDRQLPLPGWDLPGVMAAGGVQALLKGHRTTPGTRVVVAGTGPFLLPVATQLAAAGAEVIAVCEANSPTRWARHLPVVAASPAKIREGAEYALALARQRVPYRIRTVVSSIRPAAGGDRVGLVDLSKVDRHGRIIGRVATVDVDLVALGWGFTPSLELVTSVGADTRIDLDGSLVAVVDQVQRSSVDGVLVAGEATGVGGAQLALAEGELAGITASGTAGHQRTRTLQRRIASLRRFASAMHDAHPLPAHWQDWLTPDTVVCRCEEIDHATVVEAREQLAAPDVRTVKLMARPGMGWCQGRVCGFATACIASKGRPLTAADLRPVAKQSLTAPISLGRLATEPGTSGTGPDTL